MKMKWDKVDERFYETGCDHGVLYPQVGGEYPKGVVWNGLTSVNESPSGAESTPQYADNMKYLELTSAEEYGLTIECLMYPDEFAACNGESELAEGVTLGQQRRNSFGFSYRTKKGSATEGEDYGYKIHLVYGCKSTPSEQTHSTINDSPEASTFSFEATTTPVSVSGLGADGKPFKPVSHITIDSTKVGLEKMAALEEILYGTDGATEGSSGTDGRLPLPDELKEIFAAG